MGVSYFSHLARPVPPVDWIRFAALIVGVFLLLLLAEAIRSRLGRPPGSTRKFVHILVGVMASVGVLWLRSSLPLALMGAIFTASNYLAYRLKWFRSFNGETASLGTTLYPFSFLLLVLFAWDGPKAVIVAPMLILAFADAGAAIVGQSLPRCRIYVLVADRKTWEGSVAMFLISTAVLSAVLLGFGASLTPVFFLIVLVTSLAAAAFEALSGFGSDNLTVPLGCAVILSYALGHGSAGVLQLSIGTLIGAAIAWASAKTGLLSPNGSVAAFWLAVPVFGFGGWKWTVPMLVFFVLSSLLSRLGRARKERFDGIFEKGSRRDWAQVLANGGPAAVCAIAAGLTNDPAFFLPYCAVLAAAAADTWATELGTLAGQSPRLITTWRSVPAGTSGGITLAGLVGAMAGAGTIGLAGWESGGTGPGPWAFIGPIVAAGLLSSLVDSILGATVQAQYRCPVCGRQTEKRHHCGGHDTTRVSGWGWINNDVVNLLSVSAGSGWILVLYGWA